MKSIHVDPHELVRTHANSCGPTRTRADPRELVRIHAIFSHDLLAHNCPSFDQSRTGSINKILFSKLTSQQLDFFVTYLSQI